jgi:hypothetical protein
MCFLNFPLGKIALVILFLPKSLHQKDASKFIILFLFISFQLWMPGLSFRLGKFYKKFLPIRFSGYCFHNFWNAKHLKIFRRFLGPSKSTFMTDLPVNGNMITQNLSLPLYPLLPTVVYSFSSSELTLFSPHDEMFIIIISFLSIMMLLDVDRQNT